MDGWRQQGMTLIEVLVAIAVLGLGVFAAAGLQLRALQATDSALRSTQAAYLAQGVFEQARANGGLRNQDPVQLKADVQALISPTAKAEVVQGPAGAVVHISWDDSRAGLAQRSLSLAGQAEQ